MQVQCRLCANSRRMGGRMEKMQQQMGKELELDSGAEIENDSLMELSLLISRLQPKEEV